MQQVGGIVVVPAFVMRLRQQAVCGGLQDAVWLRRTQAAVECLLIARLGIAQPAAIEKLCPNTSSAWPVPSSLPPRPIASRPPCA